MFFQLFQIFFILQTLIRLVKKALNNSVMILSQQKMLDFFPKLSFRLESYFVAWGIWRHLEGLCMIRVAQKFLFIFLQTIFFHGWNERLLCGKKKPHTVKKIMQDLTIEIFFFSIRRLRGSKIPIAIFDKIDKLIFHNTM